jgi:acyl-CoA synthetase (AMP-forming)/AMP-acid ligase II/thioesterase domain-containing protein/acyl carrier protein
MTGDSTADSLWATFCELAERIPDVEALLSPGRQPLRFADLPARLQSIREALAEFGVGRGDRVVSVLPRGPETAVCYLGVASCATYIPLNSEFSEAEMTRYLTQLRPAAVIVQEGRFDDARRCAVALGVGVINLVSRTTDVAGMFSLARQEGPLGPPRRPIWNGADDYALVLLTSGSTAKHKAVPLRVRHLLAYALAGGKHYALGPTDRCLHVMPMFHGHGLKSSLLVSVANGSGVIISPHFDVPTFFQQMKALRPTWYSAAASIHQAILDGIDHHRDVARNAQLRFVRSGSSRLDPKVLAGLEQAFGAPVLERFGMSETGSLTSNPLPPAVRKPGSVGRPMGNEVAIVDERGNVLGPNRQGEIVARGPSVFDGYLDNPEATRAAFLDGWFRTGDLGRFDDDGYLTITGRIKDVINRGGEKIGTAEVESVLLRHPEVMEACVFGLPHPTLGEEVAAAVSTRRPVTQQELQTFARGLLTVTKVPRRVFSLPSLPKSSTNKVRRLEVVALCTDLAEKSSRVSEQGTPRAWSPLEEEIARRWKDLLGIKTVELDDDFFLVGGDSLKAAELFMRLQKTYRVTLGLRQIFEDAATVAGMARLIERSRSERSSAPPASTGLVTIKASGTRPPLFALPGSGGNPIGYIHLGRLLDLRQPLIGIESRGLDSVDDPLPRMEDIAADNVARIRTVQPSGPYYLTGACFGGRVAYEMARQLEASGERVGLLLLLDASAPFCSRSGRPRGEAASTSRTSKRRLFIDFVARRVRKHLVSFMTLRGEKRTAFVREKMATLGAMIRHRDAFRGDPSQLHHRAVRAANKQAGRNYVPGPFQGRVALLLTRGREIKGERNYRLDWLELVPQVGSAIYVAGENSGDMLNLPHVYQLADVVNSQLEAVHKEAEGGAPQERRAV